jgi:hypothetical protein
MASSSAFFVLYFNGRPAMIVTSTTQKKAAPDPETALRLF